MDPNELEFDITFVTTYLSEKLSIGFIRYEFLGGSQFHRLKTKVWEMSWSSAPESRFILSSEFKGSLVVDSMDSDNMELLIRKHIWRQHGRAK